MTDCKEFQFGLVCLIMAAFTGLAGFAIVYHYATSERPLEQFAIVIDAGSTQTRSSLFMIDVDVEKLINWTIDDDSADDDDDDGNGDSGHESNSLMKLSNLIKDKSKPLSKMIEVKKVSECVNGGPLAQIQSELSAKQLVNKCLLKFARHIRRLDFISSEGLKEDELELEQPEVASYDADEVAERLALLNHRVNSVTHMHLGATAGMRALSIINNTRAKEKINWIDKAISEVNSHLNYSPYINKGFVDIITGSDEAAFGWTSVNFVCDKLEAKHRQQLLFIEQQQSLGLPNQELKTNETREQQNSNSIKYNIENDTKQNGESHRHKIIESVGTLELGGASSQISFQVPNYWSESRIKNISMEKKNLQLFNRNYNLATRSDLCLGMSQAILRVKFVLLRDNYNSNVNSLAELVNIENPCFQNGSKTNLSSSDVIEILKAPCLVASDEDSKISEFKASIDNDGGNKITRFYQFIGTGNTDHCNIILSKLLEPEPCRQYFSLCPKSEKFTRRQPPPINMPFVTISGYNKALQVLKLDKKLESEISTVNSGKVESNQNHDKNYYQTVEMIQDNLGGYSIDYLQFVDEYKKFCSIDINSLPTLFPNMQKVYHTVNCLQLVYINKLLTEFYLFDPLVSWKQLKFLLFPVKPKKFSNHDDKNDIGWSLGLLLNATSHQFSGDSSVGNTIGNVMYHHGSSVLFIMRTTVFLMFACVLLAISLIVVAIFVARTRKRDSYINHSHDRVDSSTSINV